jgi:hypothetical protein
MRTGVALLMAAIALAGCASTITGPEMPRQATVVATATVLAATPWSGYTAPERRVITTDAEWAAAWTQIHAGQAPTPARPPVDFARDVVILAAMGARPSTGFSVAITEVRVHDGTFWVRITEQSPGRNCAAGDAITSPVHAVRAPREATTAQFIVARVETRC